MARARRRRPAKTSPTSSKWVKFSRRRLDQGRQGLLLRPLRRAEEGRRAREPSNYNQKLYYHRARARRRRRTCSSTSGPTTRSGASAPPSPTTAATSSSRVCEGHRHPEPRLRPRPRRRRTRRSWSSSTTSTPSTTFVGNDGTVFYFQTDHERPARAGRRDRPRGRARPTEGTGARSCRSRRTTSRGVKLVGDRFVVELPQGRHEPASRSSTSTGTLVRDVELPGLGTVGRLRRQADRHARPSTPSRSFTTPTTIYRYDLATGKSKVFRAAEGRLRPADFETSSRSSTPSKDGTQVPMFLTHRKGLKLDGSNPTLLYGYGGFNISPDPGASRSPSSPWLETGGVYARRQPPRRRRVRRGLARGRHEAEEAERLRRLHRRRRVAHREQGHPSAEGLAIDGGSNGGLLVGAVPEPAPRALRRCLPAVGVMDMLRFHKFTIGWAWVERLRLVRRPAGVRGALRLLAATTTSSRGRAIPPTLVTTADHDDRVVPAHSFKFAAALQAAQARRRPGADPHRDPRRPRRGQADRRR